MPGSWLLPGRPSASQERGLGLEILDENEKENGEQITDTLTVHYSVNHGSYLEDCILSLQLFDARGNVAESERYLPSSPEPLLDHG